MSRLRSFGLERKNPDPFGVGALCYFRGSCGLGAAATEAVVAVNGLTARWAERHHCRLAAVRTGGLEHLARSTLAVSAAGAAAAVATTAAHRVATRHLGLTRGATVSAATGIREPPVGVELLLARREDELLAAIGAGQRSICLQRETLLLVPDFATFLAKVRERSVVAYRRYGRPYDGLNNDSTLTIEYAQCAGIYAFGQGSHSCNCKVVEPSICIPPRRSVGRID